MAQQKLEAEAATLNSAAQAFVASGGRFEGVSTAAEAIALLKTEATGGEAATNVGLRGSLVDPRMSYVEQTATESAGDALRVVWDLSIQKFAVRNFGEHGIKAFTIDESLADVDFGEADRAGAVEYAVKRADGTWVWEFADAAGLGVPRPPETLVGSDVAIGFTGGDSAALAPQLKPPGFSMAGGTYGLKQFDLTILIHDWNAPGTSQIFYSTSPGTWNSYDGVGVRVTPGMRLEAYAASTDPDWLDSSHIAEEYNTTPVQLALDISLPQSFVTYAQAGGAMIIPDGYSADLDPADIPGPDPLEPGVIFLSNGADIPLAYHNSDTYQVHWTYDSSDPASSPTRESGSSFSGGFRNVNFDFHPSRWGNQSYVWIRAMGLSAEPTVVTNSAIRTEILIRLPSTLRPPSIALSGYYATLSVDTAAGDVPVGARIFYTTDGSSPGTLLGGPSASAQLYTEPVPITEIALLGLPIKAITVGPEAYEDWFFTSESVAVIPPMPIVPELALAMPKRSVTYAEVGGQMIPGNGGAQPVLVGPATATLANPNSVPLSYQNSGEFVIQWTYDGSDPRTGNFFQGNGFSGGFPGQDIPVSLDRWPPDASQLLIELVAKSVGGPKSIAGPALLDSDIASKTLAIAPLQLRKPRISLATDKYYGEQSIELDLDSGSGDTPVGARIFYTLDGSTPTPQNGTLYQQAEAIRITTDDLPPSEIVTWAIDKQNGKILAIGDTSNPSATTTDFGTIKYVPAGGGALTGFSGEIGAAVIDQNNVAWFVVNKAIDGYGNRPLFKVDLNFLVLGESPVAEFARNLPLETLSGQPLATNDQITSLALNRTSGLFTANWNTQYGENLLVEFSASGSALTLGATLPPSTISPKLEYDLNGDLFVTDSSGKISRIDPATGLVENTYVRSSDGRFYVTDSSGKVVLVDSVTGLEFAKVDTGDASLALDGTPDAAAVKEVTALASADSWLDEEKPNDNRNRGGEIRTDSSAPKRIHGVLQFDLSGVANATAISSASVSLRIKAAPKTGQGGSHISIHRITAPWLENTVNWSNKAANYDAAAESVFYVDDKMRDTFVTSDISQLVGGWISGEYPNYGIMLIADSGTETKFESRETGAGKPPFLTVSGVKTATAVSLAQATATSPLTYTTSSGGAVTYASTSTDDASLLFPAPVDTSSLSLSSSPSIKKGKKPKSDKKVKLRAAVYAPEGFDHWFLPSSVAAADYKIYKDNGKGSNTDGVVVNDPGLAGGHIDVDTSTFIASIGNGSTDGHVHEYDGKFNVTGVDFFNLLDSKLSTIGSAMPSTATKFKLIVANADLSPGGRLSVNKNYLASDPSTYTPVKVWDDTALSALPIYSLAGGNGTVKLEKLGISFPVDLLSLGGVIPTNTGDVRSNVPGKNGEWRNGALTIQAVAVNPDGSDAFTTDRSRSNGGVQGIATSGLLWESTIFYHWHGPSYHLPGNRYVPGEPFIEP